MSRQALAPRLRLNRAQWVGLIADAHRLARLAQSPDGGAADGRSAGEVIDAFRRALRGAKGEDFPDAGRIASTGRMAEAFVQAGLAFCDAAPERRSAIAPALGMLARVLDDFMGELRTAEARGQYWAERD